MDGFGEALAWLSVAVTLMTATALILERLAAQARAVRRVVGGRRVAAGRHCTHASGVLPGTNSFWLVVSSYTWRIGKRCSRRLVDRAP